MVPLMVDMANHRSGEPMTVQRCVHSEPALASKAMAEQVAAHAAAARDGVSTAHVPVAAMGPQSHGGCEHLAAAADASPGRQLLAAEAKHPGGGALLQLGQVIEIWTAGDLCKVRVQRLKTKQSSNGEVARALLR